MVIRTERSAFEIQMETQQYIINFIRKDYTKDMDIIELEKS